MGLFAKKLVFNMIPQRMRKKRGDKGHEQTFHFFFDYGHLTV